MSDYDVQIISLVEPSDPTPLGILRPAVLVRNAGLTDVVVTGSMSAYELINGTRLWSSALQSKLIPAGEDRAMYAVQPWTPPTVGTYSFTASISAEIDQVVGNNQLPPTSITITTAAAPPTATHGNTAHSPMFATEAAFDAHATRHQLAGADPINVEGLSGLLAGPQNPKALASLDSRITAPPGATTTIIEGILPANFLHLGECIKVEGFSIHSTGVVAPTVTKDLVVDSGAGFVVLASVSAILAKNQTKRTAAFLLQASLHVIGAGGQGAGHGIVHVCDTAPGTDVMFGDNSDALTAIDTTNQTTWRLRCTVPAGAANVIQFDTATIKLIRVD